MTESTGGRRPAEPPALPSPPPFVERRVSFRRAADQLAHRETVLLARSLDVLAGAPDAEHGLAGLLRLVASTARARRAAVLSGSPERRVAVHADPDEDPAAAHALAAWLDASGPRSRAARAASGPASIAVATGGVGDHAPIPDGPGRPPAAQGADPDHYRLLAVRGAGDVVLGFAFGSPVTDAELAERLPPQLVRHAAVALALVTRQVATEREVAALRARDEERTRFVSTVAHELRTPLTGLSGYLDLILEGKVDDRAVERDFLERGRGIVASMGDLVGDLLELSRLESGSLRLEVAPFSLAEAVTRVVDRLEPIALRRGVRLSTALPPRLRAATGDRRRTDQVLTNLVANALKFTPSGSAVEVASWFDAAVAVVAVRDEGPGIGPDDRARVFDRFYRIDRDERVTGTGLGLPIARELARAMAGDLDVASVPGSGTSFVLVLPGPASVDDATVRAVLDRTVAAEEIRLEESAVVRALQAVGRTLPRPRLVVPEDDAAAPRDGGPESERPVVQLRAIDGLAGRSTRPRDPARA